VDFLDELFSSTFMPHGHCYQWTPAIVWGHAVSDAIIALAYYSIPVVLIIFVRRRPDAHFSWVFVLFATFILACGTGHLLDIWNIWHAEYGWSAVVRVLTALASLATAIALWPLLPEALRLPSHLQLQGEVAERRRAEASLRDARDGLEVRVQARIRELEEFAEVALDREDQMIALKQRINELCAELGRAPEHDLAFLDRTSPGETPPSVA